MKNPKLILVALTIMVVTAAVVLNTIQSQTLQQPNDRPTADFDTADKAAQDNMSPVVSGVEKLSIVSQRWGNSEQAPRMAEFELKNETEKVIVAIAFESRDGKDIKTDSIIFYGEDKPYLALAREVFQVSLPSSSFTSKRQVRISAVVYADRTSAGDVSAAKELKDQSDEYRNKKTGGHQ